MIKNISLLLMLFCLCQIASAKNNPAYQFSLIPEELKESADAVILSEKSEIDILSLDKLNYHFEKAICILNESGNAYADVTVSYSKSMSLNNLRIALYDPNGKLIEKVKSSDINDYSASGESMFTDVRVKHYEPLQKNYPYTIVYSYDQSLSEYTTMAGWYPYDGERCSVLRSSFRINAADPSSFKYKMYNSTEEPEITEEKGTTTYFWHTGNLKAYKYEPYASPYSLRGPLLVCAPTKFQYDKIEGSTESWNDLAKWFATLNKGRDVLDAQAIADVKALVKDCKNDFDKVKTLYEYLQNKTRYVSIQVGIGSQQPFPAQYVQEKSYGDCKALSNYMKALLKVVDIPSYYTIITAEKKHRDLDTSFVRNFGNHVILMIPIKQDTVWLECTNKFSPCGFLSTSTDDRTVLCISEKGGKLARTSAYPMQYNTQNKTGSIEIHSDGTAKALITEICSGLQYSYLSGLTHLGVEDQKKKIYSDLDLPDFKIIHHEVSQELSRIPSSQLKLELDIRNYASKSGNRLFIPLNLIHRTGRTPKKVKDRQTRIYYNREYCDTDTIQFILPEGYQIESMPKKKVIDSDFGSYTSEVIQNENQLSYVREIRYKKFDFPAERYEDLRNYRKAVIRADKAKLVLVKK